MNKIIAYIIIIGLSPRDVVAMDIMIILEVLFFKYFEIDSAGIENIILIVIFK